jgi:signal transduction histidine kinase
VPTVDSPAPILRDLRSFLRFSFVAHLAFLVLRFTYLWLDDVVRAEPGTFLPTLIEESTGSFGSFLLSAFTFYAWRRAPLISPHLLQRAPLYLLLGVALSVANTTFMWGSRTLLWPLLGFGEYDYGRMPLRYLMELPQSLIGMITMLAAVALVQEMHTRSERAHREAALERALAAAQLQAVRAQLQPHFLFNALNTISARVHDDPALADRLISQLATLLRASLRAHDAPQVPLREELALLEDYIALLRARFGDRLEVEVDCASGLDDVLVPPLLLQPIVENAIRHGGLEREGRARVTLRIRRAVDHVDHGPQLEITVHDDGPGMPDDRDPLRSGTGLSSTAQRLALLHGDRAQLTATNAPGGGFMVHLALPAVS